MVEDGTDAFTAVLGERGNVTGELPEPKASALKSWASVVASLPRGGGCTDLALEVRVDSGIGRGPPSMDIDVRTGSVPFRSPSEATLGLRLRASASVLPSTSDPTDRLGAFTVLFVLETGG